MSMAPFRRLALSALRLRTPQTPSTLNSLLSLRGGVSEPPRRHGSTTTSYETLSNPAPGTPFHFAFPVHDLGLAKEFYGGVLGCVEGRSSEKWQDYSLHGHQIVAHWVGEDYRCQDYYNPVDGDEVPVPHTGLGENRTGSLCHDICTRMRIQYDLTHNVPTH